MSSQPIINSWPVGALLNHVDMTYPCQKCGCALKHARWCREGSCEESPLEHVHWECHCGYGFLAEPRYKAVKRREEKLAKDTAEEERAEKVKEQSRTLLRAIRY